MFEPLEIIPRDELETRWNRLRAILDKEQPQSEGIMLFSRVNIYWASGHFGNGVFWLPKQGEPYLFIRKGIDRAELESVVENKFPYRSYSDILKILKHADLPLPETFSVEMSGLSWSLGNLIESKFKGMTLLQADAVINKARAVKTNWEVYKMSIAGQRHFKGIYEIALEKIRPGMNEREMAEIIIDIYLSLGHCGIIRMQGPGEELFIGHISSGDSGIYPTSFNGPIGNRGVHPAVPHLGYGGKVWKEGEVLLIDTVFSLEGYLIDKSQLFFAGKKKDMPDDIKKAQDFCLMIQNECAKKMVPGNTPEDIYIFCIEQAQKYGFLEGFMGLSGNKVPFVGHGIGLYLDEWPPLAKGFKDPFEENMTIAIEPKIGIQGVGMVGVENTFLVTPSGGKSLSGDKFDTIYID